MPDYQLLIFDWDGTLVDSIGRIVESMRRAADVCGLPQLSDEAIKGIIGLGLPEAIQTLYPQLREAAQVERFRVGYGEHYMTLESEPSALFPGVAESLESFRDQGYRLAVATGKSRRGLDEALRSSSLGELFDATRTADETASKPHPRMLLELMAEFGVEAGRTLTDFNYEQQADIAADYFCLKNGFPPRWCAPDPALLPLFERLLAGTMK